MIDLATANRPGSVSLKITSMACAHGILFAGGFKGECVWKVVQDTSNISNQFNTTNESRSIGITNYTDIVKDKAGVTLGIVSNNDATIKCINLETAQIEQKFSLPFAANVTIYIHNTSIVNTYIHFINYSAHHCHLIVECFV